MGRTKAASKTGGGGGGGATASSFKNGPVLWWMIDCMSLAAKKVTSLQSLDHPFSNALGGMRYVYMLDDDMKWKVLPPMPKADSHIEFAWRSVNHSIIIVGGTTVHHPETKKMTLVGEVFQFDLDTLKWSVVGKLPYRVKTTLVGFWDGWLYFTST